MYRGHRAESTETPDEIAYRWPNISVSPSNGGEVWQEAEQPVWQSRTSVHMAGAQRGGVFWGLPAKQEKEGRAAAACWVGLSWNRLLRWACYCRSLSALGWRGRRGLMCLANSHSKAWSLSRAWAKIIVAPSLLLFSRIISEIMPAALMYISLCDTPHPPLISNQHGKYAWQKYLWQQAKQVLAWQAPK